MSPRVETCSAPFMVLQRGTGLSFTLRLVLSSLPWPGCWRGPQSPPKLSSSISWKPLLTPLFSGQEMLVLTKWPFATGSACILYSLDTISWCDGSPARGAGRVLGQALSVSSPARLSRIAQSELAPLNASP